MDSNIPEMMEEVAPIVIEQEILPEMETVTPTLDEVDMNKFNRLDPMQKHDYLKTVKTISYFEHKSMFGNLFSVYKCPGFYIINEKGEKFKSAMVKQNCTTKFYKTNQPCKD